MKLSNILGIALFAFLFGSCGKEDWVEIDSLSSDGNEFFSNQKVKLWMNVKSNKLTDVDYKWGCEGGKLTQPQGLDEMTWQAPAEPGTYRVYCRVKIGNNSETRYHDMNVSSFFFEKFEKSSYSFKGQSGTTLTKRTETTDGLTNGYLEAVMKSTSASSAYIYYNFGSTDLHAPLSCMAKLGWISDFPADAVKVGSSTFPNQMYYQFTMNRDPDKQDIIYIDDIRFEWYPVGVAKGLPVDPVTGLKYNGCLRFEQNLAGVKTWHQVSVNVPELNFAKGVTKNVAINIDADYIVHIYVGGVLILQTDAIKTWRVANNCLDDIYFNEWRLTFPNGNGGNKPPKIYFDNANAQNNNTMLTGN